MNKILAVLALAFTLVFGPSQAAGQRPADMTASGAIVGTQIVWCPIGTSSDLKCTFAQVAAYVYSLASGDCTITGVGAVVCTKTNGTNFSALATTAPGTGVATALAANVGSAGAFVVNGGALGTPSSGVGTNLTGTAAGLTAGNVTTNANLTGAVTSSGNATSLGSFSSSNLATALTDETGSGANVFGTAPTISSPTINTAATFGFITGSTQCLHVNTSGVLSGTGSDCGSGGSISFPQTVGGTTNSGGIPYFSNSTTLTSSAALAANALVIGGGAGVAPATTTTGTGILTWLGTPSSANLRGALTDETGTGAAVFAGTPTIVTPDFTTGFTIATAATSGNYARGNGTNFVSSAIQAGDLPVATTGAFGAVKPDGSTITISGGVISAPGGGSGTVTSVSAGCGTSTGGSPITSTGTILAAVTRRLQSTTSDTLVAGDCGNMVAESNASSIAVALAQAGTTGFPAGYYTQVCNIGAGTATITPTTSTIGGASTYAIPGGSASAPVCVVIQSDGTNYNLAPDWTANAGLLNAGTLLAARMPALTGDVTSSAGSVATTLAAGSASNLNSGTLAAARGGAGAVSGIMKANGSGTVSAAAAGTDYAAAPTGSANTPLFNAGSGGFTNGTRTGNTTAVATSTGSLTANNCAKWDASGNIVDAGVGCGGGSGITSLTPGAGIVSSTTAGCSQSAITTTGTVSQAECVNAQTGTTYAIVDGDRAKQVTLSNASSIAVSIAQAGASTSFQAGWYVQLCSINAGVATVTPATSTIGGAATFVFPAASAARPACAMIISDGTNYNIVPQFPMDASQFSAGTLAVARGGTGLSSGTSGGVLAYTASGTLASSTALAANAIVIGGGAGAAPSSTTTGAGVVTAIGNNLSAAGGLTTTIARGTSALGTGAISSATCATVVTTTATNTATTDVISWGFNGDPTAVTGYVPLVAGMLTIIPYPTANNVNFKVCNNTNASVTPGAITLNWSVNR